MERWRRIAELQMMQTMHSASFHVRVHHTDRQRRSQFHVSRRRWSLYAQHQPLLHVQVPMQLQLCMFSHSNVHHPPMQTQRPSHMFSNHSGHLVLHADPVFHQHPACLADHQDRPHCANRAQYLPRTFRRCAVGLEESVVVETESAKR